MKPLAGLWLTFALLSLFIPPSASDALRGWIKALASLICTTALYYLLKP